MDGQGDRVVVAGADAGDFDLLVVGGAGVLSVVEELLVELLAGAKPGYLDLNLLTGGEAGHLDHLLGEVVDADGLAHVENENLASVAHGAGLEDELTGLGMVMK